MSDETQKRVEPSKMRDLYVSLRKNTCFNKVWRGIATVIEWIWWLLVAVSLISALLTICLQMGDWTIANIKLSAWFALSTRILVVVTFAKVGGVDSITALVERTYLLEKARTDPDYDEIPGLKSYITRMAIAEVAGNVISVVIAIIAQGSLVTLVGGTGGELLTFALNIALSYLFGYGLKFILTPETDKI